MARPMTATKAHAMSESSSSKALVRSGEKFTQDGVTAVKHGVKLRRDAAPPPRGDKPPWLRVSVPGAGRYVEVRQIVRDNRLATVCEESLCPNLAECWSHGTATLMILGAVCTRACRFCAVSTGNPQGRLDADEPGHAAEAVRLMGLKYVVLTSVDRDDLPDGGAAHYAACVRAIRAACPETAVEALTPDFGGRPEAVAAVAMHWRVLESQCRAPMPNLNRQPSRAISSNGICPVDRNERELAPCFCWMPLKFLTKASMATCQETGSSSPVILLRRRGVVARSVASRTARDSQPLGQAMPMLTG